MLNSPKTVETRRYEPEIPEVGVKSSGTDAPGIFETCSAITVSPVGWGMQSTENLDSCRFQVIFFRSLRPVPPAMHFIGSQYAETEVRSAGMVSVDYILQHLPYVVLPYVHMLQKLLFKYAVYPFGNSVVTWVVPFRHADSGVASTKLFPRRVWHNTEVPCPSGVWDADLSCIA